MNKRALFGLGNLASLILILIILGILLFGGSRLLIKGGQTGISFIDQWFDLGFDDITTLNEKAKTNFNNLLNEINSCKSSQKSDCICKSVLGFRDFNEIHEISISNGETKLLYIKDENEITQLKNDLEVKCYTPSSGVKSLTPEIRLKFDESVPYLEDSNGENVEFVEDSKDILYKTSTGDICWLSNQKTITGLSYCT